MTSLEISCHTWLNCFFVSHTGSLHRIKDCVDSTICSIIWGHFSRLKSQLLFKMNLMHENTYTISHVPNMVWPGMRSSLTSHWSPNDVTQHFPLNSFVSCTVIWYKHIPFQTSTEILNCQPILCKFAFNSNNVSLKKTVQMKIFWRYFLLQILQKNGIILHASNCVNITCVHRVLLALHVFHIPLQFLDPQSVHQVLLNVFWRVYVILKLSLWQIDKR